MAYVLRLCEIDLRFLFFMVRVPSAVEWDPVHPCKRNRRKKVTAGQPARRSNPLSPLSAPLNGALTFLTSKAISCYDVLLTSKESIADGKWHHLAASWSRSVVALYLDGKLVAQDTEFRGMHRGILPELRFGSGPVGSNTASFTGWIDEIALLDRALIAAEVSHQFRSAVGQQPK